MTQSQKGKKNGETILLQGEGSDRGFYKCLIRFFRDVIPEVFTASVFIYYVDCTIRVLVFNWLLHSFGEVYSLVCLGPRP